MRVRCRLLEGSRFEGMKTRRRAAAELNAQLEPTMLEKCTRKGAQRRV